MHRHNDWHVDDYDLTSVLGLLKDRRAMPRGYTSDYIWHSFSRCEYDKEKLEGENSIYNYSSYIIFAKQVFLKKLNIHLQLLFVKYSRPRFKRGKHQFKRDYIMIWDCIGVSHSVTNIAFPNQNIICSRMSS